MTKLLKDKEIRAALEGGGLETVVRYDYVSSPQPDEAAYQEIDFRERAWRHLLLAATGRDKMSKQLSESRDVLQPKSGGPVGFRVRILTVAAAHNLQNAGYHLEQLTPSPGERTDRRTPCWTQKT
jgi:hypothetical protein